MNRIKFHVKKGDNVEVVSGNFRGSSGKSLQGTGDAGSATAARIQKRPSGPESGEGGDQHLGGVASGREAGAGRCQDRAGTNHRSARGGDSSEEKHFEFQVAEGPGDRREGDIAG